MQDFCYWSGITAKEAKEALEALGSKVITVPVTDADEARTSVRAGFEAQDKPCSEVQARGTRASGNPALLIMADDLEAVSCASYRTGSECCSQTISTPSAAGSNEYAARGEPVVNLLPNFDPYLLGHKDKRLYLDPDNYKKIYRTAGWVSAVMLSEGRVVGTWKYTRRGKRLVVELEPFEPLERFWGLETFGALESFEALQRSDLSRLLEQAASSRPHLKNECLSTLAQTRDYLRSKFEEEARDVGRFLGFDETEVRWKSGSHICSQGSVHQPPT